MAVKRTRGTRKHEDFYLRLRERVTGWAKKSGLDPRYREYVLALPDLFHLVVKLMMDKRVDVKSKAILGAAIAWALSPLDLIPDALGPLGVIDDLLVLVLALDFILDRTPREVIREHWAGTGDVFALIRNVLDKADQWVGRGLYARIQQLMAHWGPGRTSARPKPRRAPAAQAAPARKPARKKAAKRTARKSVTRKKAARRS